MLASSKKILYICNVDFGRRYSVSVVRRLKKSRGTSELLGDKQCYGSFLLNMTRCGDIKRRKWNSTAAVVKKAAESQVVYLLVTCNGSHS